MTRPSMMIRRLLAAAAAAALFVGCAQPAPKPKADDKDSNHVYKPDMKAEVVPIPEAVKAALPGLVNDNIYLYLEIAPTVNLVAYTPEYSRERAVKMCAEAFVALSESTDARLRDKIEFWIIQVQPEPGTADAPAEPEKAGDKPKSYVVVWGVRPSEADAYKADRDLAKFITSSEYLLVDDVIIPAGPDRLKPFPDTAAPPPAPTAPTEPETPVPDGSITPPAPAPGSTASPGEPSSPAEPPLMAPKEGSTAQP